MYYKFNKKTLEYQKVNWLSSLIKYSFIFMILSVIFITNASLSIGPSTPIPDLSEPELIVINKNHDKFTERKLIQEIKSYHLKYPYIALAQSMLETGHWTSQVFRENHNLFGMRQARQRPTVALGTKNGHAYYNNWKASVKDYALYYSSYLYHEVDDNETEFYAYLDKTYAKGKNYSKKLKSIVKKYHLKQKFGIRN